MATPCSTPDRDPRSPQTDPDRASAALAEQLEQASGRLELLVRHLCGTALARRVDPLDLAQETRLRLLQSPAALDLGDAELWGLVRTMARRVVVDAARRARRDPRRMSSLRPAARTDPEASAAGADWAAPGPGPGTRVAAAEGFERWAAALTRLAPEHRRVLGLRRFEGLSAAQTALRMGRSESAVHSLFRRALQAWEQAAEG